jgi:hypothetical protein
VENSQFFLSPGRDAQVTNMKVPTVPTTCSNLVKLDIKDIQRALGPASCLADFSALRTSQVKMIPATTNTLLNRSFVGFPLNMKPGSQMPPNAK